MKTTGHTLSNAHRSEKVRKIIETPPSFLVRQGTVLITAAIILMAVVALAMRYPYGNGETVFRRIMWNVGLLPHPGNAAR